MHLVWLLVFIFHLDPPCLFCPTRESAECSVQIWLNQWSHFTTYEWAGNVANQKNDDFDHNLHVLAQHSKVWINCFTTLSQNTSHIAHVLVQWVSRLSFVAVRMHLTTWVSTLWKQFRCIFNWIFWLLNIVNSDHYKQTTFTKQQNTWQCHCQSC